MESLKKKVFTVEYDNNLSTFIVFENVTRNFKKQVTTLSEFELKGILKLRKREKRNNK